MSIIQSAEYDEFVVLVALIPTLFFGILVHAYATECDKPPAALAHSLVDAREPVSLPPLADSDPRDGASVLRGSLLTHADQVLPPPEKVTPKDLPSLHGNRVRIIRELGRGATSVVLLVQTDNGDHYVAKVSRTPILLAAQHDLTKALIGTPGVAKAIDLALYHTGLPTLFLEYVSGKTIAEYLRNPTIFPSDRARVRWVTQILLHLISTLEALAIIEQSGQDISPANIIIREDTGQPALIDLQNNNRVPNTYPRVLGTPGFHAPEMVQGKPSVAADVYALGRLFFYMLTGNMAEPAQVISVFDRPRWQELGQLYRSTQHEDPSARPTLAQLRSSLTAVRDNFLGQAIAKRWSSGLTVDRAALSYKLVHEKRVASVSEADLWEMTIGRNRFTGADTYVLYHGQQVVRLDAHLKLLTLHLPSSEEGVIHFAHYDLDNGDLLSLSGDKPIVVEADRVQSLASLSPFDQEIRIRDTFEFNQSGKTPLFPSNVGIGDRKIGQVLQGYGRVLHENAWGPSYQLVFSSRPTEIIIVKFVSQNFRGRLKRTEGPADPRVVNFTMGNGPPIDLTRKGTWLY